MSCKTGEGFSAVDEMGKWLDRFGSLCHATYLPWPAASPTFTISQLTPQRSQVPASVPNKLPNHLATNMIS